MSLIIFKVIYYTWVSDTGIFMHEKTSSEDLIDQGSNKKERDQLFAVAIKGRKIISLVSAGKIKVKY